MSKLPTAGISLFGNRNNACGTYDFYLVEHREGGERFLATACTFEKQHVGMALKGPTFSVPFDDRETLQQLADELGALGFVPKASQAQQGELAAIRYHLEDMRMLAKLKAK